MKLDIFTLVPHAFASSFEQRPLASVLGSELEVRLFNYRDTTPLRAGQVDDEPYGGGAGMVLRVDVVAAALDAAYGGPPAHRVVALTPRGRPLTQALVDELAGEQHVTLLSARFEGFDERVVGHLANDALELEDGLLLPLVAACVRQVDLEAGRIQVAQGFAGPSYPD